MVVDLSQSLELQALAAVFLREKNHHLDENDEPRTTAFALADVDRFDVGTAVDYSRRYDDVAYWRIRGREQQLIDSLEGPDPIPGSLTEPRMPCAVCQKTIRTAGGSTVPLQSFGANSTLIQDTKMQRIYKPGSFLRIPLADGTFGYGRVLKLPHDAYYDYRTDTPDSDLDRIASKPILFKIAVRHMQKRSWELLGWRELEAPFSQPIVQFMQDIGNFRDCTIFDTLGNSRRAEPPIVYPTKHARVHGHRRGGARRGGRHHRRARHEAQARGRLAGDPQGRDRGHRRGRGQRPDRAHRRHHGTDPHRRRIDPPRRHRHHRLAHPPASGGGHRLHPRGPPAPRPAARRSAVGEPDPRSSEPAAERQGTVDRPGGCPRDAPTTSSSSST